MSLASDIEASSVTPPRAGIFTRLARSSIALTRGRSAKRLFVVLGALALFAFGDFVISRSLPGPESNVAVPQTTLASTPATLRAPSAGVKPVPSAVVFRLVDDAPMRGTGAGFTYAGAWQHLTGVPDGRQNGTSSRAYHAGDTASLHFTGERVRLFGVKGPNGGSAELRIDGTRYALLRFYAPRKEAGVLVYESPRLAAGPHKLAIVVSRAPASAPKRRFVNIDGAAYGTKASL